MIVNEIHDLNNQRVITLLKQGLSHVDKESYVSNYHPDYESTPGNLFNTLKSGRYKLGQGKYYIIEGQRFQNVVSFAVMVEANAGQLSGDERRYAGAEVADRVMEIFEDFMLEYTPVFKRLGASELVYARRVSDTETNMDQTDVVRRTVTYLLTTEKIHVSAVDKIESIVTDIRQWVSYEKQLVDQAAATPSSYYEEGMDINIVDLFQSATPNS